MIATPSPTPAPKDIRRNIKYRRAILRKCAEDKEFREVVWCRCARDFVYWCDVFAWTLSSKDSPKFPKVPFVLYPFQEQAALNLNEAIGNEDRLVEKSRDMGATWLIVAVFVWRFIFHPDQSFLVGSRKQEFVDKAGSPKTIFWKVDYLLANLPKWMRPPIVPKEHRTINHIENPLNGSVIDGESTNESFGAGDRRGAVLLDEFALCDFGYAIMAAVGDVTNCCIYNSTPGPMGASGAYYDTRQKFAAESPEKILRFHWSVHPKKARGLYTSKNGMLEIIDKEYKFPEGYKFIADGRLRSPAYDERERRSPNRHIIATQWDIDYLKSGHQFFDAEKLDAYKKNPAIVREPRHRGELVRDEETQLPKFVPSPHGRLLLWAPLPDSGRYPWDDFALGADPASGSGGEMSSNSSASMARKSTGEKLAELTDNNINPTEFANYCLLLCEWLNEATLIWERNGPTGAQFTKVVKNSGYTKVYKQKNDEQLEHKESKNIGWWTTPKSKPPLLYGYCEALWTRSFINPSIEALNECSHYVENAGKIEHSRSLANATQDPTAVGESHGDRVIADALVCWVLSETTTKEPKKQKEEIPITSAAYRMQNRQRSRNDSWI